MSRDVGRTALTKFKLDKQISPRQHFKLTGCVVLLIAALTFSVGSGFGFLIGRMGGSEAAPSSSAVAAETERALAPEDMDIFWEAMVRLEEDFLRRASLPHGNAATAPFAVCWTRSTTKTPAS